VPDELPDAVTIDSADSDDAATLSDLWVDLAIDQRQHGSHLRAVENEPWIHETMLQHVATETALVARRSGDVVGFVTFGTESGRYEQDCTRGFIHNIYVRDADRGDGIGSGLIEAAEAELESMDVDVVALESMAENEAARAFYRRRGYTPHRVELEKPINGDAHDSSAE
jgi:ribosomal protein S18 acetylase RimI-like enzyme